MTFKRYLSTQTGRPPLRLHRDAVWPGRSVTARRWAIHLQSWRARLIEMGTLASDVGTWLPPERVVELAEVRRAVHTLEEPARSALCGRLEGQSERSLGDRFGVSRYRVRELLIEALGRVASALGERPVRSSLDARVATALWKEGRTIRDTAALLGISIAEVRDARQRNAVRILKSIDQLSSRKGPQMHERALELFKKVLLTSGDEDLLRRLGELADKIRQDLEEAEFELSETELKRLEDPSEWTARVYRVLAGPDDAPDEADELSRALE